MTAARAVTPPDPAALIPEDAPFTSEQRAWLSGFLLALLSPAEPTTTTDSPPAASLGIFYASQTGTAEGLARKLARRAQERGFTAAARDLGSSTVQELARFRHLAIVASTHGEGEPPDTALAFAQSLKDASGAPLAGSSYTVLALGDSNYAHFCRFGAFLDERFSALGATRLGDMIACDGDPAAQFAPWREATLDTIRSQDGQSRGGAAPAAASDPAAPPKEEPEDAPGTRANPLAGHIVENRILNPGSDKDVRHIALAFDGAALDYAPGDAIGILPQNPPGMVASVLAATGLDPAAPVSLDREMTLREALSEHLSIGRLTQPTLIKFAARANDPELSELLVPGRGEALASYLHGRDLIDLLVRYPGVVDSAATLAGILPRLVPRLYSIASSAKAHPGEVHLTVAAVRYQSHGRPRVGIASTYLADRAGERPVKIYLQRNTRFRLPKDPDAPVVMIGPGTGIAPFRGFLEERRSTGARGKAWLLFGERRRSTDFLYHDEMQGFFADGTLARLDTAFSRDQAEKIYVQHRMAEHGEEMWRWLDEGAHVYVCGEASRMAKDVDRALKKIVAQHGRMSDASAELAVNQMIAEGRYSRDVY